MVRQQTVEEIQAQQEFESAKPVETFSALDYTKAIASTLALDGNSIGNLIKDGKIGWLKATQNMSAKELALTISTLVIFSAVTGSIKPSKKGVVNYAKSKGNNITDLFKRQLEKATDEYNKQPRKTQLEGIQKIRQSSVDTLTEILKNTKGKMNRREVKAELESATKKLNEGIENARKETKRQTDEAAQVERTRKAAERERTKSDYEKKIDFDKAKYLKDKAKYEAQIKEILRNNPDAFKPKIDKEFSKKRDKQEMVDLFRDPKEVAKEQAKFREQAKVNRLKAEKKRLDKQRDANRDARQANKKENGHADDKASESKTEAPESERGTSKESEPEKRTRERREREAQAAREKSKKEDKPDFGDKENDPVLPEKAEGKTKTNTSTRDAAAAAAAAGVATTTVINKLTTTTPDRNPRRMVEGGRFDNVPVKEGEVGTQSTEEPTTAPAPAPAPAPTPAPSPAPSEATADISFINHKEKLTQTTKNIDTLFSITIQVATDAYNSKSGEQVNHTYIGEDILKVPVLFFKSQGVLYIGFRGTDSVSNVLTDLVTADIPILQNNTSSNFLYSHPPFDKLPDEKSKIEFFLGVILALKQSYSRIVAKIKELEPTINNIVLCGHSLGGAMAQLFTYIYNSEKHKKPIAHLVTYGQPRVLINEPKYIIMFNETVKHYHRVWNTLDPVPYVPFKKKVLIDKLMGSNIMSGYVHVGNSFNVAGNIVNNDINLLLYEILKGNKDNIEMLLADKSLLQNSKLLKFMLSDKYLELQLDSFYKCLEEVEVKKEITDDQLSGLILELQKDTSKLLSYSDKCDLLKPFGLSEILRANPIGDDLDEQNFSIYAIGGSAISI